MGRLAVTAIAALLAICCISHVYSSGDGDRIDNLPGLNFTVNFQQYSGYLKASSTRFLHYWFVESQNDPSKDPLIFWFNGGPGCSSIGSLITDNGPFLVHADGENLRENPYAWNKSRAWDYDKKSRAWDYDFESRLAQIGIQGVQFKDVKFASVVYLDAPVGVGFSYTTDGNITTDDEQTASDNYNALKDFFGKFPQFRHRRLFLSGQSYAGIYVPTLAEQILNNQDDFHINLKGIIIGNAYVSKFVNFNTLFEYSYAHGLVGETLHARARDECCDGQLDGCHFEHSSPKCIKMLVDHFYDLLEYINPFDYYSDCAWQSRHSQALATLHAISPFSSRTFDDKRQRGHKSVKDCDNKTAVAVTEYMNSDEVRQALHVSEKADAWEICSVRVKATYSSTTDEVTRQVRTFVESHDLRVLFYYGDTDLVCNLLLGQQFSASFNQTVREEETPWLYGNTLAGFKTVYGDRRQLIFLTVRGAGHMASLMRPPHMQYAVRQFLANKRI